MALHYSMTLTSEMLLNDIFQHITWYNQILASSFFSAEATASQDISPPVAFVEWCKANVDQSLLERDSIIRLEALHNELSEAAQKMISAAQSGQAVTREHFSTLEYRFDAYNMQLRRLEADMMSSGASIDHVTGLRSVSGMKTDIMRELDRSERKGGPFCIANIEIDNSARLQTELNRRAQEVIFANVADVFTKTIRSFDDAYHMGKGEYLLCLKQIDLLDACTVLDRICGMVDERVIALPDMQQVRVTISCGVAEPFPGDNLDDIFNHGKDALKEAQNSGGNRVEQYQEMSRLEAFAKGGLES